MRNSFFVVLVLFFCGWVLAAEKTIFTLEDPTGDDLGDGSLVYPLRDDLRAGDIDLTKFSARNDDDGTMFEITFAKKIATPDSRAIDAGGKTLDSVARLGFYQFNIDIYIDTDRVAGSGNTSTLPGRHAQITPDSAWERMILVTPRPADAESQLQKLLQQSGEESLKKRKGRVDSSDSLTIRGQVAKDMRDHYFVPTRIRVIGSKINFLVPRSFLGDIAQPTWSYVIAVSLTRVQDPISLAAIGVNRSSAEELMILPVTPGPTEDSLGGAYDKDDLKPPLLDIFVPPGLKQETILKNYNINEDRLVELPGVVPAEVKK